MSKAREDAQMAACRGLLSKESRYGEQVACELAKGFVQGALAMLIGREGKRATYEFVQRLADEIASEIVITR